MYTYVDWYALKLWGSVSLVAVVVLIIGLIIWCCRCCCDSCCCSGSECDYDCHCRCCSRGCSRVKKENVTQASHNESLELGEPAGGVGLAIIGTGTVDEQGDLHSSTKGEFNECSFSYEDEINDGRVSVPAGIRNNHDQESRDDVTSGVKDGEHNCQIPKEENIGRDNKGYEAGDDDDDLNRPGISPTSVIDASDRSKSDIDNNRYADGYNSGDNDDGNLKSTDQITFKMLRDRLIREMQTPGSDDADNSIRRCNDQYNSEGEQNGSGSSSDEEEEEEEEEKEDDDNDSDNDDDDEEEEEACGFTVGDKLIKRHVVMTREMPAYMSTRDREDFAYQKARWLYKEIPGKYTLIRVKHMKDFRRKIRKEAINKANGLYLFTTTESFDAVHFERVSRTEYEYVKEGQAQLELNCYPEQVVSHLAGVVFS